MKLTIKLERTFAGKQYENLKPCLELEIDPEKDSVSYAEEFEKMETTIEEFGAKWQKQVLK